MQTHSLNGSWTLHQQRQAQGLPATVPGCVHTDLLDNNRIEDPFYRDNERDALWIGETDWTYSRTFAVPADLLACERVLLRCEGLDTLATIRVNGQEIAHTDNMYRTYEFDVKDRLQAGDNTIEVAFAAPVPYALAKDAERFMPGFSIGDHRLTGGGWIRKQPSNFGWDWGPKLATCGIWRDIMLVAFDTARLADVRISQDHSQPGRVGLTVALTAERTGSAALTALVQAQYDGEAVTAEVTFDGDSAEAHLNIDNPQLWWPNGLGDRPLYVVQVELRGADGTVLDTASKRIGLRTLRLDRHPDQWGESFQFVVNGVPFFAKGANWIPADTFVTRVSERDYRRLIADTAAANMNMLRVWGGGIYEPDVFYDLCDEYGVCIWQDFMFACNTYPAFDDDFMANVKAEAEDNVRRIRHHPAIALWCGNNEIEQGLVGPEWTERTMSWADYEKLYDHLLADVVARLAPETDYWPGSPHTPVGDRSNFNDPRSGDAHLWSVWHGRQPFEWYRTCEHRFNSEFGFQSFPEPATTYGYTAPEDRNITSFVMEHHQRSGIGNSTIIHYMLDWFRLPVGFDNTLWLSQILQGLGIKYAVEHWRRAMPQGMGTLYWQLNDCWPVASWSSIDFSGRWKALHYMARRFFAPLLVSGVENLDTGTVEMHVTNDYQAAQDVQITWALTTIDGAEVLSGSLEARVSAGVSMLVDRLDLHQQLERHGPRNLLLWLALHVDGETVSDNLVLFARPKHIDLLPPALSTTMTQTGTGVFDVTVSSEQPALWVFLDMPGARYSDNFVHLRPGQPVTITVTADDASLEQVQAQLQVRSLIDFDRLPANG